MRLRERREKRVESEDGLASLTHMLRGSHPDWSNEYVFEIAWPNKSGKKLSGPVHDKNVVPYFAERQFKREHPETNYNSLSLNEWMTISTRFYEAYGNRYTLHHSDFPWRGLSPQDIPKVRDILISLYFKLNASFRNNKSDFVEGDADGFYPDRVEFRVSTVDPKYWHAAWATVEHADE
jgi:hypothetical protein